MKPIHYLTLLFSSLFLMSCSEPKAEEPDELAERIFEKIKENDQEGYEELVLYTDEEYREFFMAYVEANGRAKSSSEKEERVDRFMSKLPRIKEAVTNSLAEIRSKAEADGVNWEKATFVRAEYGIEKRGEIEATDVDVFIKSEGVEYRFKLDDCLKYKGAWVIMDNMRWIGEDRPLPVNK